MAKLGSPGKVMRVGARLALALGVAACSSTGDAVRPNDTATGAAGRPSGGSPAAATGATGASAGGPSASIPNPVASGGAPTPVGSAALPSAAAAKQPLDPKANFDWPETASGGGAICQEGTYTGTFDCLFTDPSGVIPDVELMGPVSLTFTKSMDGEFLVITDGAFEAVGNDLIGGKAKITGKLDCSSLTLTAMAVDGEWTIGDPNAPLLPGGGLEGDITGTLDPTTGTLSGRWSFADPQLGACPGTWSVMHAP
ncbi:MAG: hypothetical protein ACHQ53_14030 [Polyangiales bacterium]